MQDISLPCFLSLHT